MQNEYSITGHWNNTFDEAALRHWAEGLYTRLAQKPVTLGLVFMTPKFFSHASQILELIRVHARTPLLAGCSSTGLITGGDELEQNAGIVLGLFSLPEAELRAHRLTQEQLEEANGPGYWHLETGKTAENTSGWVGFADPFHFNAEMWVKEWNEAYGSLPLVGGLASGDYDQQTTQLYLNGDV